jgi:hypothetical protein
MKGCGLLNQGLRGPNILDLLITKYLKRYYIERRMIEIILFIKYFLY